MDDLRFAPRMSDTEALVWWLEEHDPRLRSTIAVVALLDRSPGIDGLRTRLERVSRLLPRFRDRVAAAAASVAVPRWEPDPAFDLSFHVRSVRLPPGAWPEELLRWAEPVVTEGLDRSRPLWQVTLVDGGPGGAAALLVKLHHTFTDGLGAVKLAALLFDLAADAPEPEAPPLGQTAPTGALAALAGDVAAELQRGLDTARRALPLIRAGLGAGFADPAPSADATVELVRSIARLTTPSLRPLSPILRARTARTRMEVLDLPLAAARRVAHRHGGTVNDVFLAALLAGLRRYHERHGSWPDELRLGLPISTRSDAADGTMRNQFAPVRLTLPLQERDVASRLHEVHDRVAAARAEPGLGAVDQLAAVVTRVPALRPLLAATLASVDVVASNVPGVDAALYLRGARVTGLIPFGPRNGAALNATVLSYDGTLHVGVNLDGGAVTDADVLVDSLRAGLVDTIGA